MSVNTDKRDRRDWTLIIFLLPVGIVLMLVAGQIAIRMVPFWRVAGGMESSLDPGTASKQQGQIQPILFDIQTPMAWFDTFLTPRPDSPDVFFPPFVVFEPSETPTPAAPPTASDTPVTSSPTTTVTSTPPATATKTKKPPKGDPPPATNTPTATASPTATTTTPTSTATATSVTSTPEGTLVTSTPDGFNVGAPNGAPVGSVADGTYFVVNLGGNPIIVNGPSDTNYDFVYYERDTGGGIQMDRVILSISTDDVAYYVVFNWGDGVPDANSNVGDVAQSTGTENDNQPIDSSELYGTAPQDTGILVDVDNAPSNPPAATYQYLAIQAPAPPASSDGADVDAIEVTEVAP
jgi:hypothetical protein